MPAKNHDLHGQAPDASPVALILIDLINDLEFEGGDALLEYALPAARRIAALKRRARAAGIPVIYANDNFGRWRSNFQDAIVHCTQSDVRGQPIARLLAPAPDDYFVLKPKHSAFFATTFELLLGYLGVETLVLTGVTGDMCILFTAIDAYMRDLHLVVPADCVASLHPEHNDAALAYMQRVLNADVRPSLEIELDSLQGVDPSEQARFPT